MEKDRRIEEALAKGLMVLASKDETTFLHSAKGKAALNNWWHKNKGNYNFTTEEVSIIRTRKQAVKPVTLDDATPHRRRKVEYTDKGGIRLTETFWGKGEQGEVELPELGKHVTHLSADDLVSILAGMPNHVYEIVDRHTRAARIAASRKR